MKYYKFENLFWKLNVLEKTENYVLLSENPVTKVRSSQREIISRGLNGMLPIPLWLSLP